MQPGDRLICTFLQPMQGGDVFKEWPLHSTVIPWFRVNIPTGRLVDQLQSRLSLIHSFTVTLNGEAHFGHRGSKLVHLVVEPTPLRDIEHQARTMLYEHGAWIADETTKRRQEFRPHVTDQAHAMVQTGDTFVCADVYIVEQQGSQKVVAGEVGLSNEQ